MHPPDLACETNNIIFSSWLIHIKEATRKNNGKVPYGLVSKVVKDNSDDAPWLTRDILNHHLKKHKTALVLNTSLLHVAVSPSCPPANITPSVSPANNIPCDYSDLPPLISLDSLSDEESDNESDNESDKSPPLFRLVSENCGRPRGSTANKRKLTEIALSAAKNQITDIYSLEAKKAKHKKKRVKKVLWQV